MIFDKSQATVFAWSGRESLNDIGVLLHSKAMQSALVGGAGCNFGILHLLRSFQVQSCASTFIETAQESVTQSRHYPVALTVARHFLCTKIWSSGYWTCHTYTILEP